MGMCHIDKDNGTTGLTDEEIKGYEFNTHYHRETKTNTNSCPSYHPSNSIKSQVRESNCSPAQYNVNNQRRK